MVSEKDEIAFDVGQIHNGLFLLLRVQTRPEVVIQNLIRAADFPSDLLPGGHGVDADLLLDLLFVNFLHLNLFLKEFEVHGAVGVGLDGEEVITLRP